MNLDLSDQTTAALTQELHDIVGHDRYAARLASAPSISDRGLSEGQTHAEDDPL
jgi:hypothetical protein